MKPAKPQTKVIAISNSEAQAQFEKFLVSTSFLLLAGLTAALLLLP